MKLGKNKTGIMWLMMTVVLAVIGYDAWACEDRENRDTISHMVTESSKKYLIIPFIFGLLVGHFFWSQHLKDEDKKC